MAGGGVAWEVDAGVPSWGRLQGLMRIDPRERETRFREGRSIHPAKRRTEEVAGVVVVRRHDEQLLLNHGVPHLRRAG